MKTKETYQVIPHYPKTPISLQAAITEYFNYYLTEYLYQMELKDE